MLGLPKISNSPIGSSHSSPKCSPYLSPKEYSSESPVGSPHSSPWQSAHTSPCQSMENSPRPSPQGSPQLERKELTSLQDTTKEICDDETSSDDKPVQPTPPTRSLSISPPCVSQFQKLLDKVPTTSPTHQVCVTYC